MNGLPYYYGEWDFIDGRGLAFGDGYGVQQCRRAELEDGWGCGGCSYEGNGWGGSFSDMNGDGCGSGSIYGRSKSGDGGGYAYGNLLKRFTNDTFWE